MRMGGRGDGMNWEMIRIDISVLLCVNQIASGKLLDSTASSGQCSVVTKLGGGGREGGPIGRGDTCIHITNSACCTTL